MTRGIIHIIICFAVILFAACNFNGDKRMPSLRETYSYKDKKPFGAYIANRQLKTLFPGTEVKLMKPPFSSTWSNIRDTASIYFCLTPDLYLNKKEATSMLDYVYKGNSLFISAEYIDEYLLKQIHCTESYTTFGGSTFYDSLTFTHTGLFNKADDAYAYYYVPFRNYFTNLDSSRTRVLGTNQDGRPNFIVYFYGSGKIFLHCDPRAFSNYFLLQKGNYRYLQNALTYVNPKPEHLYWDDYYNKHLFRKNDSDNDFSTFREIMKHPPLKAAFWLAVLLLGFYIFFNGKRRQRIIPLAESNENSTVAFTETIGRLYLQNKDNKNIAEKMITYFNEYIRNTYYLTTTKINNDFITTLSNRSGVSKSQVEILFSTITTAQQSDSIDDFQLLSLNKEIQEFYKKRK